MPTLQNPSVESLAADYILVLGRIAKVEYTILSGKSIRMEPQMKVTVKNIAATG